MPPSPVPLDPAEQQRYDELFSTLGQARADSYAQRVAAKKAEAVTIAATAPTPTAAPAAPAAPVPGSTPALGGPQPVIIPFTTSPSGRITVGGPQGTEPRGPTPPMQDIVISQPSRAALQQQIDKARQDAVERRVKELQAQGIADAAARSRAQREIDAAALAPRLTEFGAPARPAGYSEFAVRGAQAAGELTPEEAFVEGFTPQVLETGEQAESRRRYEAEVKKSKQVIEEEAKRMGITPDAALPRILMRNQLAAVEYVKNEFGEDDPEFMTKVQEVQAAMNAPYFAGAGELRPKMLGEAAAGRAKDILRGLTTSEVQGRLVETRGVAAMRGLGGLSRVLVRGAEEAVVDPIMRNVVAAVNPGVTADQLKQQEEEMRAAAGGSRVVSGPGVQYSDAAATRRKADTGSFARDVAFEIATGRSAVDDYIDAGMSEAFAVPLGIATEFAIPVTPIGAVTDVAPAFRSVATGVARAARVPAGAARAGTRAALGAAVGGGLAGPIGAVGGAAIGALTATKRVGQIVDVAKDIPQVAKLRAVAKGINTIPQFGEAIASSRVFREAFADAGSVRTNLAEAVTREGADIGQVRATFNELRAKLPVAGVRTGEEVDDAVKAIRELVDNSDSVFARETGKFLDRIKLDVQAGAKSGTDALDELGTFINKAYDEGLGSQSPITRTAIREGDKLGAYKVGDARDIATVREKVLAETIDAVPTDNYFFVTDRMLVKRSLLNTPEFKEAMKNATSNLPPDASLSQIYNNIEETIRTTFRGRSADEIAEAANVNIPRTAQEEGVFAGPRGGLERLQTPPSRRMTVVETYQDIRDTIRSVTPWYDVNGKNRFGDALVSERVPVNVAEFMRATGNKLDNVPGRMYAAFGEMSKRGVTNVIDSYTSARIAEDLAGGNRGVFDPEFYGGIDDVVDVPREAMNDAVKEIVNLFFGPGNLRIVLGDSSAALVEAAIKEAGGNTVTELVQSAIIKLRAADKTGQLNRTGIMRGAGLIDDQNAAIVQYIMSGEARAVFRQGVQDFMPPVFGKSSDYMDGGLRHADDLNPIIVAGQDVTDVVRGSIRKFLTETLEDGAPRIDKITEDMKWISQKTAGKYVYGNFNASDITEADLSRFARLRDIIIEDLRPILRAEGTDARVRARIARDELSTNIESVRQKSTNDIASARERAASDIESIKERRKNDTRLVGRKSEEFKYSVNKEYDDRIAAIEARRDANIQRINDEASSDIQTLRDDVKAAEEQARIDELDRAGIEGNLRQQIESVAKDATNDYVYQGMVPRLQALGQRLEDARAAAGWDSYPTVTKLSELVDLPLPAPLAAALRGYFGSIDDLTKMKGIIGDNIREAVSISPSMKGLGQRVGILAAEIAETVRAATASGLTAGLFVPNFRYHAVNFETAPLVQAFTSPAYLADTLGARITSLIPGRKPNFFGVPGADAVRSFRSQPDKVMIVTDNGVQYTAGQLNRILDETFFGMSANTFVMSERMLDDVIMQATAPSGIPGFRKTALEGIRYLGGMGTNPFIRYANKVDRAWRETAFLAALKNGLTPEASMTIAKNAFLDYGKIPASLKSEFGKYMMFASWMIMNNMELLRAFLTSKGGANIIKINKAQREMHRAYGDWTYSDDATKKRLWSDFIGDFDGVPAFSVGPENPAVGPMLDNIGPAFMTAYLTATGDTGPSSDAVPAIGTWLLKNSFTPAFQYAKDVGLVGPAPMSDIVPAKSIAAHQMMGPDHFQEFMDENGITVVPYDKRRPGEPTFNGEQYQFVSDSAKEKWARTELIMTFLGTQRAYEDAQSYMLYAGINPPGMDAKRLRDMEWYDLMLYMGALETRQKGKTEYEAYMRAMTAVKRELTSGQGVPRIPESDLVQFEPQQAPQ